MSTHRLTTVVISEAYALYRVAALIQPSLLDQPPEVEDAGIAPRRRVSTEVSPRLFVHVP